MPPLGGCWDAAALCGLLQDAGEAGVGRLHPGERAPLCEEEKRVRNALPRVPTHETNFYALAESGADARRLTAAAGGCALARSMSASVTSREWVRILTPKLSLQVSVGARSASRTQTCEQLIQPAAGHEARVLTHCLCAHVHQESMTQQVL